MINLGLNRISLLLNYLPTAQTWTAIHIAGTNGKGSVASYLSSLLRHLATTIDGLDVRVGKFTSPHLIDRWDCITINDKPVSQPLFLSVERQIQKISEKVNHTLSKDEKVTEFELLTATAFEIFSQQKCQVAVVECGLGGRLDATNALDGSKAAACVVTKIGLDHQGLLGNTVEEIAREKAGIAKKWVPFIYEGSNIGSVKDALTIEATRLQADPVLESAVWPSTATTTSPLTLHQRQNLGLAMKAYEIASQRILSLQFSTADPSSAVAQILSDASENYPGRLQHLSIQPLIPSFKTQILLDGAHNPQSATVLREYVDSYYHHDHDHETQDQQTQNKLIKPTTWILGASRGKDLAQLTSILLKPHDRVVTCSFGPVDGMPWVQAVDPHELANAAAVVVATKNQVQTASDVVEALEMAARDAESPVVVAGSLYLVSDLLRALRDGPSAMRDRMAVRK